RQRDQDAEGAGPVRADTHLHVGHDLAFDPDDQHDGDQERGEDRDDPREEKDPAEPVELRQDGHALASACTDSKVAFVVRLPERSVLVASPGWLYGTKAHPGTIPSVTLTGSSASPAGVRSRTFAPSSSPSLSASDR